MRIALIGDLHFYSLVPRLPDLLSKRIAGYANLWFHRRKRFDMKLFEPIVHYIRVQQPDLLLFTGDLTTTATPAEFQLARQHLAPLLRDFKCMLIPGNHDRYTFTAARNKRFEAYFTHFAPASYPHHCALDGGLHLVAVDATRPNILSDNGKIGDKQCEALTRLMQSLPEGDRVLMMCHYSLGSPPGAKQEAGRHAMLDVAKMMQVIVGSRPVLYVHGHVHQPWCWQPVSGSPLIALNAGAPFMTGPAHPHGQGFWMIDTTEHWHLSHHQPASHAPWIVTEVDTRMLAKAPQIMCTMD